MKHNKQYLKKQQQAQLIKIELLLTPILIIIPITVSTLMISEWIFNGYLRGTATYDGELAIGLIITLGNLLFAIPFLKTLKTHIAAFSLFSVSFFVPILLSSEIS